MVIILMSARTKLHIDTDPVELLCSSKKLNFNSIKIKDQKLLSKIKITKGFMFKTDLAVMIKMSPKMKIQKKER